MPYWILVPPIAVAAILLLALVWWVSGRARPRGRGPDTSVTQSQAEQHLEFQARNISNLGGFGGGGAS